MRGALSIAIAVTVLAALGLGLTVSFRARVGLDLLPSADDERPVVILVLGQRDGVEAVREALPPESILYADRDVLALEAGRIVATRVEAATAPLNELGWVSRPLEIIDPTGFKAGPRTRAASQRARDGGPSLAELAQKPALTTGDTLRALRLLR